MDKLLDEKLRLNLHMDNRILSNQNEELALCERVGTLIGICLTGLTKDLPSRDDKTLKSVYKRSPLELQQLSFL